MKILSIQDTTNNIIKEEFSNFINEISQDDAYNKFYKNIDRKLFNRFISLDPTVNNNQIGKYLKWIVNMHNKGELNNNNDEQINKALELFDKFKQKLQRKDINQYKTINDLLDNTLNNGDIILPPDYI